MDILKSKLSNYYILIAAIVGGFFIIEAVYYIVFLNSWFDEANHAYKAWITAEGFAEPFVDFRNKYAPLAFYMQVFFQKIFGPTLIGARILSSAFLVGIVLLVWSIAKRIGNKWTGLVAASLLIFNPYLIGYYVSVKPYAAAVFFMLLGIWILSQKSIDINKKIIFASLSITAGMLIRYNMIPAVILLWFYVFLKYKSIKHVALSILTSVIFFSLSYIPYALLDLENSIVWFLLMFGPLTQFMPFEYFDLIKSQSESASKPLISLFGSDYLKRIMTLFVKYFHLWVIFSAGIVLAFTMKYKKFTEFPKKNDIFILLFFLTVSFLATHFLMPSTTGGTIANSLYFLPFLILSVAGLLHLLYVRLEDAGAWDSVKEPLIIGIAITILLSTISISLSTPNIIFFNHFDYSDSDLSRVKRGAEFLKLHTTKEDLILSFDSQHQLLLAGRYEIPELTSTELAYFEVDNTNLLSRYNSYNADMVFEWMRNDATAVVFQRDKLEESILNVKEGALSAFKEMLISEFELVGSIENVYPRQDIRGNGVMDIYKRK